MPSEEKKYFAFISYSHKDEKFAKHLHKWLEAYHLPVAIARQYPRKAKNLRPIWWDQCYLSAGVLNDNIQEAIENSRYLIVLCTPNSAKPNDAGKCWIDIEVQSFLDKAQENKYRLLPVIYRENIKNEGQGSAEEPRRTACLPKTVAACHLLAIDINDFQRKGKEHQEEIRKQFGRLAAFLAGLKPDDLMTSWEQAEKSRRYLMLATVAFGLLCVLGSLVAFLVAGQSGSYFFALAVTLLVTLVLSAAAAYGTWRWYTPRTTAYAYYDDLSAPLPCGHCPLSQEEVKHRAYHYRFTSKCGRLIRIECCNSAGIPIAHKHPGLMLDAPPIIDLRNDDMVMRDKDGHALRTVHFSNGEHYEWVHFASGMGDFPAAHRMRTDGVATDEQNAPITRYRIEREYPAKEAQQGLCIIRCFYCNAAGTATPDTDGTWGREYRLELRTGLVLAYYYLSSDGAHMANRYGCVGCTYTYDEKGGLLTLTHVNGDGQPVRDKYNFAIMRCTRDYYGRCITRQYSDEEGNPCYCDDLSLVKNPEVDEEAESEHKKTESLSSEYLKGLGISSIAFTYNDAGFLTRIAYFGAGGKPCLNRYMVSSCDFEVNDHGDILSESYFGVNRKTDSPDKAEWDPVNCKQQFHKAVYYCDDKGNRWNTGYYDDKGHLCPNDAGVSIEEKLYDIQGRLRSIIHLDKHKKPVQFRGSCYRKDFLYDARGNTVAETCFEWDEATQKDKPGHDFSGVSRMMRCYDDYGRCTAEAYFNWPQHLPYVAEEQQEREAEDYACWCDCIEMLRQGKSQADVAAKLRPWSKGESTWQLALHSTQHVAIIISDYHINATKPKEKRYYGVSGEKVLHSAGVWREIFSYNDFGQLISAESRGLKDTPCLNIHQFCRRVWNRNNRGQVILTDTYDDKGCLCGNKNFSAAERREYNEKGLIEKITHLDTVGEYDAEIEKGAVKEFSYDARNNITEMRLFSAGSYPFFPTLLHRYAYDEKGNRTQHVLVKDNREILRIELKYDKNNHVVRIKRRKAGQHPEIISYKRNALGLILRSKRTVRPVDTRSYAYGLKADDSTDIEYSLYDQKGNEIAVRFFGGEQQGPSGLILCYDEENRPTKEVCLGQDLHPHAGACCLLSLYSAQGQLIQEAYQTAEGKPISHKGFAYRETSYDSRGRLTAVATFDAEHKLCDTQNRWGSSYAVIQYKYDNNGRLSGKRFLSAENTPVLVQDAWAKAPYAAVRIEYESDTQGHLREHRFLYNLHGQMVEEHYS